MSPVTSVITEREGRGQGSWSFIVTPAKMPRSRLSRLGPVKCCVNPLRVGVLNLFSRKECDEWNIFIKGC